MVMRHTLAVLTLCASAAVAGQTQQLAGVENPWDVRTIVADLNRSLTELKSLLDRTSPQQWVAKTSAPSTYILTWQTAERQVNDVLVTNQALTQKTDSLSLALDDYFRLEALDVTARSLEEGVRRYGDRTTSDKLNELIASNFGNRERFRNYIRDLASTSEQNFKTADEEAQRCRGMISKETAPAAKKAHR